MTASLKAQRQERVGWRPTTLRTHRRKADVEGSLPESCHWLVSRFDPNRASRLPASRRSGKAAFRKFRCLEAAVRDLTHPATTRHWPPNPDSSHPGEAVCSQPMRDMSRITPLRRQLRLLQSCYVALRVVCSSKQ